MFLCVGVCGCEQLKSMGVKWNTLQLPPHLEQSCIFLPRLTSFCVWVCVGGVGVCVCVWGGGDCLCSLCFVFVFSIILCTNVIQCYSMSIYELWSGVRLKSAHCSHNNPTYYLHTSSRWLIWTALVSQAKLLHSVSSTGSRKCSHP